MSATEEHLTAASYCWNLKLEANLVTNTHTTRDILRRKILRGKITIFFNFLNKISKKIIPCKIYWWFFTFPWKKAYGSIAHKPVEEYDWLMNDMHGKYLKRHLIWIRSSNCSMSLRSWCRWEFMLSRHSIYIYEIFMVHLARHFVSALINLILIFSLLIK